MKQKQQTWDVAALSGILWKFNALVLAQTDDVGNNCPTPKKGGDYYGIGLLEPCWKVLEKIMVK
jgi:hypothetical protein